MRAIGGGHGATPLADRQLAERRRELVAELPRHQARRQRLESVIEQGGIAQGIGIGAGLSQLREQSGGVVGELVPSAVAG